MILETFPVGPLRCNCSILGNEADGTAVVIDPGGDPERIASRLARLGLTLRHLIHTHAHLDHVGGSAQLKAEAGGQAWLHQSDQWLHENLALQGRMIGISAPQAVALDGWLSEGDRFDAAGSQLEVLHTPGHSPGSCSFVLEADGRSLVFAGDTLFSGSIGRTDLWGGDPGAIVASLRGKLMELDDEAEVICGHGPGTTIGRERHTNPFLTGGLA